MSQVFSGCRGILKQDGQVKGWATDISGSLELQQTPIEVLGQVDVSEYVTTGRRVSGQMSYVRLVDSDIAAQGLVPPGGAPVAQVVEMPSMTMLVEDQVTGKIMYQFEGLKITGANWSMTARGIVATNCNFVALRMKLGSDLAA